MMTPNPEVLKPVPAQFAPLNSKQKQPKAAKEEGVADCGAGAGLRLERFQGCVHSYS